MIRVWSFILLVTLLVPYAIQLDHFFEDHDHIVCHSEIESHIHQSEVDCHLFDYKINQVRYHSFTEMSEPFSEFFVAKNYVSKTYFSASTSQTTYLRGPPCLV